MNTLPHLAAATAFFIACAPAPLGAFDAFTEAHRGHLAAQLPNVSIKLETKATLHAAFLGDAAVLEVAEGARGMVRTFLSELQKSYYYTGGVHEVYDEAHLEFPGAKITFETIPLTDPAAPHLVQHASTVAFVNEPDLLIVCAGAADAGAGVTVETHRRFFDQILALTRSHQAEMIVLGPSLAAWNEKGEPTLAFASRPYSASLRQWSEENRILYVDPSRSLLPDSLPYTSRDRGPEILGRLEKAIGETRGRPLPRAFAADAQQRLGKAIFRALIGANPPSRYRLSQARLSTDSPERDVVETTLAIDTTTPLQAQVFPLALGSVEKPPSTVVEVTPNQSLTLRLNIPTLDEDALRHAKICYGRRPFSLLIIDPFRLEIHDLAPPAAPVGVEWQDYVIHNIAGNVEVRCQVHPLAPDLSRLPYELRFGEARSSGTITFVGGEPAPIAWNFALPEPDDDYAIRGSLELLLGEAGGTDRSVRNFEALRQFGLNQPVALTPAGERREIAEENPLSASELLLTAEATADDLMLHFDFKNITFAPVLEKPVIELDLAIDARSHLERNRLGFVGNLHVQATPEDGPATVGSFAPQSHFGNGYARRPLPSGTRALLSTRPNGTRRLTVHMSRNYFYRHPWSLGNGNSQLGINATVTVREGAGAGVPQTYRLAHSPLHPNNAESLAVLELTEKSTRRWSIRFW